MAPTPWRAALAVVAVACLLSATGCSSSDSDTASPTTAPASGPTTAGTVPRDGDPEFCTAIVDFQNAYTSIGEPETTATAAEVEDGWNDLAEASGRLVENAPDDLGGTVEQIVAAFDQLRIDADAAGYQYQSFDEFQSAANLDPTGSTAQSAYTLFTYGQERCP